MSSRQFLVVALSIYGGALLDRGRPRRVMAALAVVAAASSALFPALPHVWAAVLLQMVSGFAETTNWIGAQAAFGRALRGSAVYAGRLTARRAHRRVLRPVDDRAGLAVRRPRREPSPRWRSGCWPGRPRCRSCPTPRPPAGPRRLRACRPPRVSPITRARSACWSCRRWRWSSWRRSCARPGPASRPSFYGVWLKGIGFEAGDIGFLIGLSSAAAAGAALGLGRLTRRVAEHRLLIAAIALTVAAIAVTPLLDAYALLAAAICLRGAAQGINLPLMMSIAARAVGPELQGRAAALRITFNRLGGALVPVAMGAVAEAAGVEAAFYAVGAAGLAAIGLLALWTARAPAFRAR